MPDKRKKGGGEEKQKGVGRKQKVKDEKASKLSRKNSRNFAFCACPNFESCNLASGTKASPVLDL